MKLKNNSVKWTLIALFLAALSGWYITSGIAAGEKVVIAGPADLADGDSVKEIKP